MNLRKLIDPVAALAIEAGDLPAKSLAYVFNNRGASYRNLNQYNRAIEDYDQAIKIKPEDADAYVNRGISYAAMNQHDLAIEDYDLAIKINDGPAVEGLTRLREQSPYLHGLAHARD